MLAYYELLLAAESRGIQAEAEFSVRKDVKSKLHNSYIYIYYSQLLQIYYVI